MSLDGIDVSSHQTTTPSLVELDFVFVRATYGTTHDSRYDQHAANVRRKGLVLGAYHFGRNLPPKDQVREFLEVSAEADLWALDLERDGDNPRMTDSQARAFIDGIRATGRRCGLYHSESGFPDLGQDFDWVANWSSQPTRHWTFWQHRGSPLDLDRFNGNLAELRALKAPLVTPRDTSTGDAMSIYFERSQAGTFVIPQGATVTVYDPGDPDWTEVRTYTPSIEFTGRYDARVVRKAGTTTPSSLVHVSEGGFLEGHYLSTAEIVETDDPAPVTYTQADLNAAITEDRTKAHVVVAYD